MTSRVVNNASVAPDLLVAESGRARIVREQVGRWERTEIQGPLADAMTHARHLALLRRLAGVPVPPESFVFAEIDGDRLGPW